MAEFKIDGRMKVKTLKEKFKEEFGGTLRVYNGNKTADGNEKGLINANISSNTEYVDVACVWTENALYFYYDGDLVRKEAIKSNSSEKVYPILGMSIAGYNGNTTWLGSFTDADLPNLVSYVDSFSISK